MFIFDLNKNKCTLTKKTFTKKTLIKKIEFEFKQE